MYACADLWTCMAVLRMDGLYICLHVCLYEYMLLAAIFVLYILSIHTYLQYTSAIYYKPPYLTLYGSYIDTTLYYSTLQ